MKQYKIIKIVNAKSFAEATKLESKGEIILMELNEEIEKPNKIGFK
jgi:hypothetical protein